MCDNRRITMLAVCYGPFPPGQSINHRQAFEQMRVLGFNSVRCYDLPDQQLLDAAAAANISVFAGLAWGYGHNFIDEPHHLSQARVQLDQWLRRFGMHPALRGVYVANEIPTDLVRWLGAPRVLEILDLLILEGKFSAPHLLFAYANYPSTEFLEPSHADFTAMNVYLEHIADFSAYLQRLHHIAGDRPLVISEFGLDAVRHSEDQQSLLLEQAGLTALQHAVAGTTVFSWSDLWWNQNRLITDWKFGLMRADGSARSGARSMQRALEVFSAEREEATSQQPLFSIIVCTRNGRHRIGECLDAIANLSGNWEALVIDDGSTDGTEIFVTDHYPWVRVHVQAASGLSAARNRGASLAKGSILAYTDDDCQPDRDWIDQLAQGLLRNDVVAMGGPNMPPCASDRMSAIIAATAGSASHVMLDDQFAEHLPGCNFAVRRSAFDVIGGFQEKYHTAGDDVDFCWRLLDHGFQIGFAPCAFVWHRRRASIGAYWKQQWNYGRAEAELIRDHPHRFHRYHGASWQGRIYQGGPVRGAGQSIIYHGPWGTAPYQIGLSGMHQQRPINLKYDHAWMGLCLLWVNRFGHLLRSIARNWHAWSVLKRLQPASLSTAASGRASLFVDHVSSEVFFLNLPISLTRMTVLHQLSRANWQMALDHDEHDLLLRSVRLSVAQEHPIASRHRLWFRLSGPAAEMQAAKTAVLATLSGMAAD